jgi:ribosome-associated protein
MSTPYIESEVKKVLESAKYPQNMALASAWVIAHFKGINIKIFDAANTGSLCDYNIIASAENTIQAKSMIDEIQFNLKQTAGAEVISLEGLTDSEWILLDLGDIIVHIFQETSRDIYDLDTLWAKSEQIGIPQEFYFGQSQEVAKKEDPTENFF